MKKDTNHKTHISHVLTRRISILIIIAAILFATLPIWANNGYVIFSDIDFGMNDKVYIERILGIFNDGFSSMNFFNLSRLFFITPFYLLSLIFSPFVNHFLLKSVILGVMFISAFGMYRLCEQLLKGHFGRFESSYHYLGLIVPSLFYALNPWVIFRVQHIFLLPGYAVLPWILRYFMELFRLPETPIIYNNKKITIPIIKKEYTVKGHRIQDLIACIKIAIFISIGAAAIHYFFFIVIIVVLLSVAVMAHNMLQTQKIKRELLEFIKKHIVLWGATFIVCSYWIMPYVLSTFFLSIEPGNVNVVDTLNMFSRYSNIKNIVYLISYWWPMFDYAYYLNNIFWIAGGVFLFLIVYITLYRFSKHFYVTLFTFMTFFILILATGVNSEFLAGFNVFVVTKIPIIGHIFRDPNKLVGVMAAFFSILIGFSVDRNIYLLRREGYGRILQIALVGALIVALYFYIKPFKTVYIDGFYKAVDLPDSYTQVNEKHLDTDGKVLWVPNMENMVLNNGVANYEWNLNLDMDMISAYNKTVGDFHFYSSSKDSIFQHEGNTGGIAYMYSFLQHLLDNTGGQNYGEFISFLGFDEVAYHNDALLQEQRQEYNKGVMDASNLESYYSNDIFTLFQVPRAISEDSIDLDRTVVLSEGLYKYLYALEDQEALNLYADNTAVLWQQSKKQSYKMSDDDLIIGDNYLDMVLPMLDKQYTVSVFDPVNTGNPSTGWAKSKTNTPDWGWMHRVNQLQKVDFEYDYGEGYIYTYTGSRMSVPSYEIANVHGKRLISIQDVLGDFFTSNNSDILNLTVFPNVEASDIVEVLYGETRVVENSNNLWQVASSKMLEVENLGGTFISVDALISGINAGSLHFKIHFYDEAEKELGVAYVSRGSETANYKKSKLICNTYVPVETKKMKIELMNSGSTTEASYFWLHDFNIFDLTVYGEANIMSVPFNQELGDYHGYLRVFKAPSADKLSVLTASGQQDINLMDHNAYFEWVDLGTLTIDESGIDIQPYDGLNVVSNLILVPEAIHDQVMDQAASNLGGQQLDYAYVTMDYKRDLDIDVLGLDQQILYPNSMTGYLEFVGEGTLNKEIDVLFDEEYVFSLYGQVPDNYDLVTTFTHEDGSQQVVENYREIKQVDRTFTDSSLEISYTEGDYYLSLSEHNTVDINQYIMGDIFLKKGHYTIEIELDSVVENKVDIDAFHKIIEGEIYIKPELFDNDQYLLTISASVKNEYFIEKHEDLSGYYFTNEISDSKLWMIYGSNQIYVEAGDIIIFEGRAISEGLTDVHSKMFVMDDNKSLMDTIYIPYDPEKDRHYIIYEARESGYIQPAFFARSDGENKGYFKVTGSQCYNAKEFSKLEATSLIPSSINQIDPGDDQMTRLYMEAFNPLWRASNTGDIEPLQMNFFYNGYVKANRRSEAEFYLIPMFFYTYYTMLGVSIAAFLIYLMILIWSRKSRIRKSH